ncbi:MAG: hypothetical protein ACON38_06920 [Akkermansiaceae bacterium]
MPNLSMDPNQPRLSSPTTDNDQPVEELPTLVHGVPEPEVYLPPTPLWVWIAIGIASFLLLLLIIWLVRKFHKPALAPLPPANHLPKAIAGLNKLEASLDNQPLSEVSTEISLIIRSYFASTRAEPALYETTEEFQSRQIDLPKEATDLLNELSDAKYSKTSSDQARALAFIDRSRTCLETIHAARHLST